MVGGSQLLSPPGNASTADKGEVFNWGQLVQMVLPLPYIKKVWRLGFQVLEVTQTTAIK